MYKHYTDVAINVLNERIYDINAERSNVNLSEQEKEELHDESTKLHRAINELKKLKEND